MQPTGDPELDALAQQAIQKEVARLERNADRREAREKQKGKHAGSPAAASPAQSEMDGTTPQKGRGRTKDGTARKCANCGQVGHIKTNRKSVTFSCLFCQSDHFEEIRPSGSKKQGPTNNGPVANAGGALSSSYSKFAL